MRAFDRLEAELLPRAGIGAGPAFSPDGQWLAGTSGSKSVTKVPLSEGLPVMLAEIGFGANYGLDWVSNDALVHAGGDSSPTNPTSPGGSRFTSSPFPAPAEREGCKSPTGAVMSPTGLLRVWSSST